MPWVIWDILVPLLVTFLIGLSTGWLLWRWRRQRTDKSHSSSVQNVIATQEADDSANTILINERDEALERASRAEAELQSVKSEHELSIQELQLKAESVVSENFAADRETADSRAEVESLNLALEQEKNSKAELERSLLDLNSRYKQLSSRLEEAVNNEEAEAIKQSAAVESEVERSREKIAEQQEALRLQTLKEQKAQEQHVAELAEKQSQLDQLQSEKNNLQSQLAQATANLQSIENQPVDAPSSAAIQHISKVHQLSAYSAEESSLAPGYVVNRGTEKQSGSELPGSSSRAASVSGNSTSSVSVRSAHASSSVTSTDSNTASELEPEDDRAVEPQPLATTDQASQDEEATSANVTSISSASRKVNTSEQKPATQPAKKSTSSGYIPTAWSVPDKAPSKAERDNLQEIKGVGPVLEKMLHKTGIWYFRQVAMLDKQGVIELDNQLPQFSGRIQRDKWVKQAKALHKSKYGSKAS